jgi:hypothetical protein
VNQVTTAHKTDWSSYSQLIQQIIAGTVRRNVFSQWEMRLMLDLQHARIRKTSRPEILRRYLKAVEQQHTAGAPMPLRFSNFFESDPRARRSTQPIVHRVSLPRAS